MKRFLISLILFLLFTSIFYIFSVTIQGLVIPKEIAGNLFIYNQARTYTASRIKEADSRKNVDILIIGSSHAYRGYDVRTFTKLGYKTLNLGTSAQTLLQTKYLLTRYLNRLKPKIILLDIYPTILNSKGDESTLELVSVMPINTDLAKMAIDTKDIRVYNTLISSIGQTVLNVRNHYINDKPSKKIKYISGGYVEYHNTSHIGSFHKSQLIISPENIQYLKDITNMLKLRNINYIIFQSPLPKAKYNSYTNNPSIDAVVKNYGPYYNYNTTAILPDSCFSDYSHLNSKGVAIYNQYVIERLRNEGVIE
jgi:hypothetical protein